MPGLCEFTTGLSCVGTYGISSANTIIQLTDVDIIDEVDGATLVYNGNTGMFDIKPLNGSDIVGTIDDGLF